MRPGVVGRLVVFVYVGAVLFSVPAAATALVLARRMGVRRATGVVSLVLAAVVAMTALTVAVRGGTDTATWFAAVGFAAFGLLWALPVRAGAVVVQRTTGLLGDAALGYAVAGLPVGMLGSVAWFYAAGEPLRFDPASLSGLVAWLALGGSLLTVLAGPGLAGTAFHRLVRRRR